MGERRIVKGWIYERGADGSINPVGPANSAPQMPAKPTFDLERPKMGADINNTQASTNRTVVQTQGDALDNQNKVRTLRQNPLGDKDQALINAMRLGQGDLSGVLRDITAAQGAVDRFRPAPGKGVDYAASVPSDADGWWGAKIKDINSWFNGVTPQGVEDYQTLLGLQNQSVLNSQIAQKGPQTESDAVRMKLAGVSPNKDVRPNAQLLAEQQYDVMMKQARPGFYVNWANKLGSTQALNAQGKSADDVWNEQYRRGYEQMRRDPRYSGGPRPPKRTTPWYGNVPRKPKAGGSRVIDFNDLPE